jgi:hypothetical protein
MGAALRDYQFSVYGLDGLPLSWLAPTVIAVNVATGLPVTPPVVTSQGNGVYTAPPSASLHVAAVLDFGASAHPSFRWQTYDSPTAANSDYVFLARSSNFAPLAGLTPAFTPSPAFCVDLVTGTAVTPPAVRELAGGLYAVGHVATAAQFVAGRMALGGTALPRYEDFVDAGTPSGMSGSSTFDPGPRPGVVTLKGLRDAIRERSDFVNNDFVTDLEFNGWINASVRELYDLLLEKYGCDYYMAEQFVFLTVALQTQYLLPGDFYKLLGIEWQASGGTAWATSAIAYLQANGPRNAGAFTVAGAATAAHKIRMRADSSTTYRLTVDGYELPASLPVATALTLATYTGDATFGTLTLSQTVSGSALTIGDQWHLETYLQATGTLFLSIPPFQMGERNKYNYPFAGNAGTYGYTPLRYRLMGDKVWIMPPPASAQTIRLWFAPRLATLVNDTDAIDAVSGWEEIVILDVVIKAKLKDEGDVSAELALKAAMIKRIEDAAADRDIANAAHTTDNLSATMGAGMGGAPFGDGGPW